MKILMPVYPKQNLYLQYSKVCRVISQTFEESLIPCVGLRGQNLAELSGKMHSYIIFTFMKSLQFWNLLTFL